MPPGPLGNLIKMDSTAALFPEHGSNAMGFGTACRHKTQIKKSFLIINDTDKIKL